MSGAAARTAMYEGRERRNGDGIVLNQKTLIVILGFLLQVMGAVYYYGSLNERVTNLNNDVKEMKQDIKKMLMRDNK